MPTLIVGAPAAIALFVIPLWGIHRNLLRTKQARLEALRARLRAMNSSKDLYEALIGGAETSWQANCA